MHRTRAWHNTTREVAVKRLLDAICELIEAHAARIRTDTLECEFDNADWAKTGGWADDDD